MSTMNNIEEVGLVDLTNEQLTQVTGGHGCGWSHGGSSTSVTVGLDVSISSQSHGGCGCWGGSQSSINLGLLVDISSRSGY